MNKIILLAGMALVLLRSSTVAQTSIWNSPDAYLGEKQPGDTPIVFARGRLAETNFWVGSRVAFTEDGRQFLYGKNTSWFDGRNQKFMSFRFDGKRWIGPTVLHDGFSTPTFAMDGKTLYLSDN